MSRRMTRGFFESRRRATPPKGAGALASSPARAPGLTTRSLSNDPTTPVAKGGLETPWPASPRPAGPPCRPSAVAVIALDRHSPAARYPPPTSALRRPRTTSRLWLGVGAGFAREAPLTRCAIPLSELREVLPPKRSPRFPILPSNRRDLAEEWPSPSAGAEFPKRRRLLPTGMTSPIISPEPPPAEHVEAGCPEARTRAPSVFGYGPHRRRPGRGPSDWGQGRKSF